MLRFYCGVGEKQWNHHPVAPGQYACVSPVKGASARTHTKTGVFIPEGVEVIQDSGAFSDSQAHRLDYHAALERQIAHADQYHYGHLITHRASYDILIDEVWVDGNRFKRRWSVNDAEEAVEQTVAAAQFLSRQSRSGMGWILSAQGVDAIQYLRCAEQIVDHMEPDKDILGLGGWCIIGKMPKLMMPVFRDTLRVVIPFAQRRGVRRVHIWGVVYPKALGELLYTCDQHGIEVSTDSVGASTKPVYGEWGYGDWIDHTYKRPPVETRGMERARHVQATIEWLQRFRETQYYRPSPINEKAEQLILWSA